MPYEWIALTSLAAEHKVARAEAAEASRAASRAEAAMYALQDQLDRQALLIRSLLLLLDRRGLTNEDEFREILEEVDLSDGRRDGKYKPLASPKTCPQCNKANNKRAVVCIYCGSKLQHEVP